jgi:hypothetical protein
MSKHILWGSIFGIAIGAVSGEVLDSTALGIGIGAAIAVIVAIAWSVFDRNASRHSP